MDNTIKPTHNFLSVNHLQQVRPAVKATSAGKPPETSIEPSEVFEPQVESFQQALSVSTTSAPVLTKEIENKPSAIAEGPLQWEEGDLSLQARSNNGPLASFINDSSIGTSELDSAQTKPTSLEATLKAIANASLEKSQTAQAMSQREATYLARVPFKDDEKALKTRAAINERYNHPSTSAKSVTDTINDYASKRGINLKNAPSSLSGSLTSDPDAVKRAAQQVVDKLFLSKQSSFNPEKHKTVSAETARFIDLALQAEPKDLSAADAYKLVASNLALISYQDQAAAENMLGDHGVRHLLGHNIKATEQLADGLEKNGVPVGPKDRLIMHQAMILHDLGYAMDSVRNPINKEGLKGQDAGHNVLAARYLKERSLEADDPINKLFSSSDLEAMHRCILYHDKDASGGPGVQLAMSKELNPEERSMNLETMMRVADNSHAFEDKLPELLYSEPQTLKTLRLMKTAGEIGDDQLVNNLKSSLAESIKGNPHLAVDDREALLKSAGSLSPESYRFSVGRIAGSNPTFDISPEGKILIGVKESDTHQQAVGLFGLPSYNQMEKFIADCTGQKTKLNGSDEVIEGNNLAVSFQGGGHRAEGSKAFNAELTSKLLDDFAFTNYSFLDNALAADQKRQELLLSSGRTEASTRLDNIKARRRELLSNYRNLS